MKTITKKGGLISILVFSLSVSLGWVSNNRGRISDATKDFLSGLLEKLHLYETALPEDRVYLQFDKPFYEPGDDIWFSGFVRNGATLKPSIVSRILHVELINPNGGIEKEASLIAKNGIASGDFSLDAGAKGGLYKVRAYTNCMKNEADSNVFEKTIQVQDVVLPKLKMKLEFEKKAFGPGDEVVAKLELNTNENRPLSHKIVNIEIQLNGEKILAKSEQTDDEGMKFITFRLPKNLNTSDGLLNIMIPLEGSTESVSRAIPIVLNKIKFDFFPEGGDLVTGLESKVGFRAMNEFGKPADVEGKIYTKKGNLVAAFHSFHQGMGAFSITPKTDEKYYAVITRPVGITDTFTLPAPLPKGNVLCVENSPEEGILLNIRSGVLENMPLVLQIRGKVYYSSVVNVMPGNNKITIPSKNLPQGVAQITLFDNKGVERAERLTFVNQDKHLKLEISTDKEKYLPREKVRMTLNLHDAEGHPTPGHIAMGVVNDQFLSFVNDKSGNILSELLLQQDIREKIEEPAYYFNEKEAGRALALDYLLMTAGWRRFTWEQILEKEVPQPVYAAEPATITGDILDGYTGKPIVGATFKINNKINGYSSWNGKFSLNQVDLYKTACLTIHAPGYNYYTEYVYAYDNQKQIYLYPRYYYTPLNSVTTRTIGMQNDNGGAEGEKMLMPASANAVVSDGNLGLRNEIKRAIPPPVKPKPDMDKKEAEQLVHSGKAMPIPQEKKKEKADGDEDLQANMKVQAVAQGNFNMQDAKDAKRERARIEMQGYYRARTFPIPVYKNAEIPEQRTDFRNTIYWNPDVEINRSGHGTIEFFASDDITSFRVIAEGITTDGNPFRGEHLFYTQLPFELSTKLPVEVSTEDQLSIPVTLKNNTDKPLGGFLSVIAPEGLKSLYPVESNQTLMPHSVKTIFLDYQVLSALGEGTFSIGFKSCGLNDAIHQNIRIKPKGFPVEVSFSGQEMRKDYTFSIDHLVKGSLKATFTAFPNVLTDLMKGVEGILREPGGCFEQTSMSAYPNAMVLDYLRSTDSKDEKTMHYATSLLDKGYNRLITFEAKDHGYEWFGASPAHEGLTAYGIMEFTDMKRAGGTVDQVMMDRTTQWLLAHKDGKGGFSRNANAYHDFGRISEDVMNGYIVYALAEAGVKGMDIEFNAAVKKAKETKDAYLLAMMANAAYQLGESETATTLLKQVMGLQAKDGSFTGATHSITYSTGASLTIETTSLAIMAILKSNGKYVSELNNAVRYLSGARSGFGAFGSTQGTVLALKALTTYAKASRKTSESGSVMVYLDGKKIGEKNFIAGEKGAIIIDSLEKYITVEGMHTIRIGYEGIKEPLPYSMSVAWSSALPANSPSCALDLQTKYLKNRAEVGETVRLCARLENLKNEEVPSTMAIVGIPAGFTVQPWQLKEMQEKKVFDYYEIIGNNIAFYYRGMAAKSVKEINLDLKAEMPGVYEAPASSAYLYYTNEFKTWTSPGKILIKKPTV